MHGKTWLPPSHCSPVLCLKSNFIPPYMVSMQPFHRNTSVWDVSILNLAGVHRWIKELYLKPERQRKKTLIKEAQSLESCFKPLVCWVCFLGFFGSVLNLNESGGWMALQEESPGAMQVLMCWLCIFYQKRDWDVHFWWRQHTSCFVAAPVCLHTDTSAR